MGLFFFYRTLLFLFGRLEVGHDYWFFPEAYLGRVRVYQLEINKVWLNMFSFKDVLEVLAYSLSKPGKIRLDVITRAANSTFSG
jgi:hypothetical protein